MNQGLMQRLEELRDKEVRVRDKLVREGRLFGVYEEEMQQVHRDNARALDRIIEEEGWPGISRVGPEGARAAWLIAQHSICTPDLQRKFLAYLVEAGEKGDVPIRQVAWLTDRIRFNEGKPQVYGTVYDWNEHGELTCEVEDPGKVDELRASVGLPPLQQALEEEKAAIRKEGGGPPGDYAAYRQAATEWATRVGWR